MVDFVPFPLGIVLQNDEGLKIQVRHPDTSDVELPLWADKCGWTDPPPPGCFPGGVVCPLHNNFCDPLPGGPQTLSMMLSPLKQNQAVRDVVEGADLGQFPPHLLPIIYVIDAAAKKASIDLNQIESEGLTVIFHKKNGG